MPQRSLSHRHRYSRRHHPRACDDRTRPYLTDITDLTATANGGGSNQGEPASNNPPPSITSHPAALSTNLPEARLAFDHVPALTIEAISENGFDIKDLWKLDPLRIAELNHSGSRQLPLPARTGDERY